MARTQQYTSEQIINALKDARGMVYAAARRIGCHADTIYTRAKDEPAIRQAIEEERGIFLDTAEIALMKAVQEGQAWAVCFTLKTQGKDRGYVERQEVSGPNGGPVPVFGYNITPPAAQNTEDGSPGSSPDPGTGETHP